MKRRTFLQIFFGTTVLIFASKTKNRSGRLSAGERRLPVAEVRPSARDFFPESKNERSPSSTFSARPALSTRPTSNDRIDAIELRPGDVLAARWADERKNSTPGYWNHLGIVAVDAARIVESQESADGAIATPFDLFFKRYSNIEVARYFCAEIAKKAARFAENRVVRRTVAAPLRWENRKTGPSFAAFSRRPNEFFNDQPLQNGPNYSRIASIWPRIGDDAPSDNCVSLVRRAFLAASGVDYRWRTPDSLFFNDRTGDFRIFGRVESASTAPILTRRSRRGDDFNPTPNFP